MAVLSQLVEFLKGLATGIQTSCSPAAWSWAERRVGKQEKQKGTVSPKRPLCHSGSTNS